LVVFDGVPGGTGYLSDLWHEEHFLDVLEKALSALQSCVYQQDPERDGCYRCLFAYQSQRELPDISSREAQAILRAILEKRDQLKTVRTLSEVTLESKLESELETKFLHALRDHAQETKGLEWEEKVQGGELCWILRTEGCAWEIRAQVDLGAAQGVSPACRPDFLIRPANADPAIRPIAVFCDGLAFHACPGREKSRIADDIQKRAGILASGKYAVWSVAWKDVVDLEESPNKSSAPLLFSGLNQGKLGRVGQQCGLSLSRSFGTLGSMSLLLAFMLDPRVEEWEKLARTYSLTWMTSVQQWIAPEAGASLEARLESDSAHFKPGPMAQVGSDAPVLTRCEWNGSFVALARSSQAALRTGKIDRVLLRLFDDKAAREDRDFEHFWRGFLQAWNLLQFQEGVEVVSSELVAEGPPMYDTPVHEQAAAEESTDASVGEADSELTELLAYATEASRELILKVAEAELPLPRDDFELETAGKGCGPEPELAWPDLKVAVLGERQAEDQPAFEAAGWRVLLQPVDPETLLITLRNAQTGDDTRGD